MMIIYLINRCQGLSVVKTPDKFVKWALALGKTPDYFLLGIDYGDDSKDGKILQICGCLKNCSDSDIDTVLMLVQGMNSKNN